MENRSRNSIWVEIDNLWSLTRRALTASGSAPATTVALLGVVTVLGNAVETDTGVGLPAGQQVNYPNPALTITTTPVTPGGLTPHGNFMVSAVANVTATPGDVLTAQLHNEAGAIGPLLKATADANGLANFSINWFNEGRGPGAHQYFLNITNTTDAHTVAITASGTASLVVQENL
jgi:hypothetical protein